MRKGTQVQVARIPRCDICKSADAEYDAKSAYGPWGYMCQECFEQHGIGLGTGRGQRLVLMTPARRLRQELATTNLLDDEALGHLLRDVLGIEVRKD